MNPNLLNAVGLSLNVVGVVIAFKFGFPQPSFEEGMALGIGGPQADQNTAAVRIKKKRYRRWSLSALALILSGLVCQGFGLLVSARDHELADLKSAVAHMTGRLARDHDELFSAQHEMAGTETDLQQDVERIKESESKLSDAIDYLRGTVVDSVKDKTGIDKELSEIEERLLISESKIGVVASKLDTKADDIVFGAVKEDTDTLKKQVATLENKVGFIDKTFSDQLSFNQTIYGPDPNAGESIREVHVVTRDY
jgi:hypothetical protein